MKQVIDGETIYSVYSKSGAILYRENVNKGQTYDYIRIAGKTITYVKEGNNVTVRYRHQDHLGSLVAQTKPDGTIQWQEDYTPFGEKWLNNAAADDEGFTGHIDDTMTGLTYMQARYYDPVIGQFLSNDPVGFSVDQPQMFNRYSYVANDPVNATDPDGRTLKLIRPVIKAARNGGNVGKALKETGLEVGDALLTIADPNASPLDKATAVFDLASPLSAKELKQGGQLAKNQLQGAFGEATLRKRLGDNIAGEQVTLKAPDGTKARFDFITKDGQVLDAKTGNAGFSKNQQVVADQINAGNKVTPVGNNAVRAELPVNEPVKFSTCRASRIDGGC